MGGASCTKVLFFFCAKISLGFSAHCLIFLPLEKIIFRKETIKNPVAMSLFKLRGKLNQTQQFVLTFVGLIVFILLWWAVAELFSQNIAKVETTRYLPSTIDGDSTQQAAVDSILRADSIRLANATEFEKVYPLLPTPLQVVKAYPALLKNDGLLRETLTSIWRNLKGYFWAILFSLPIGFLIGLLPLFRGMFRSQVDALRYLPLTALTGLFVLWFGTAEEMKVAFLAFGIIVYLLPVIVQRIDEVEDTYLTTVFTLGANAWQTIRTVYLPYVFSRLIDDIRVLTAISWTYIIIAEYISREGGGIGSMIQLKQRLGKRPDMFAILLVIILVGFLQDRIFVYLDKRLFPHKYYKTLVSGLREIEVGIAIVLGAATLAILLQLFIPVSGIVSNLIWILILAGIVMLGYGEFRFSTTVRKAA
jgi:NitT/TauT family transport system permease protein